MIKKILLTMTMMIVSETSAGVYLACSKPYVPYAAEATELFAAECGQEDLPVNGGKSNRRQARSVALAALPKRAPVTAQAKDYPPNLSRNKEDAAFAVRRAVRRRIAIV